MSFEPNLLNIFLLLCGLLVGTSLILILSALKIQEGKLKKTLTKKFTEDTTALKKEIADFKAADGLEQKRNFDRTMNVAEIKAKELIIGYSKWEKSLSSAKVFLSTVTTASVLAALLSINYTYRLNLNAGEEWIAALVISFIMSYLFWSNRMENYWKKAKINEIKAQYMKIAQFTASPLDVKEKFSIWVQNQTDISEGMRKTLIGLFDAWLKESLQM